MPLGREMQRDVMGLIKEAFYLNKMTLPERAAEMTAYEVGQRIQEYIRGAMPIFEPMEAEYNGAICEATFDLLMRGGAFGSPQMVPKSLSGAEIQFKFKSPLHDAVEHEKSQKWLEAKAMLADAAALDPAAALLVDAKVALRDVLRGIGTPALWTRSEQEVSDIEQQQRQAAQTQALLANLQAGADVAATIGDASQKLVGTARPVAQQAA